MDGSDSKSFSEQINKTNVVLVLVFTTASLKAEALLSRSVTEMCVCMNQALEMAVQNLNSYIPLSIRKAWLPPASLRNQESGIFPLVKLEFEILMPFSWSCSGAVWAF